MVSFLHNEEMLRDIVEYDKPIHLTNPFAVQFTALTTVHYLHKALGYTLGICSDPTCHAQLFQISFNYQRTQCNKHP